MEKNVSLKHITMKHSFKITLLLSLIISVLFIHIAIGQNKNNNNNVRVLLVTGGHWLNKDAFMQLFQGFKNISVIHVVHPNVHIMFKPDSAKTYDIIVFYDMWNKITEEAKTDFMNCLEAGKGVIALHHSYCSYSEWPEYTEIIGGRYNMTEWVDNGIKKPASTYKHDVHFSVNVVNPAHPVTKGVTNFEILDETYGGGYVMPDVTPLLTTNDSTSTPTICWAKTYKKARIVTLLLGHDRPAFENPAFKKVLYQAIFWTAGKH